MKPRAPKDLVNRIFKPASVERKPFVVRKWKSPFDTFKEVKNKKGQKNNSIRV